MQRVGTGVDTPVRWNDGVRVSVFFGLKPGYEHFELFAVANAAELALKKLQWGFGVAFIVAVFVFFAFYLDNIGHAGPMEHLHVLEGSSEAGRGWAKAVVWQAKASPAFPASTS